MPRAKGGFKTRRRRKKVLEKARGYYGGRNRLFKVASIAIDKALLYAYKHRKMKKRAFRALWIVRINAAARAAGVTYSRFMNALKESNISIDRKALADMAYNDPASFRNLIDSVSVKLAS